MVKECQRMIDEEHNNSSIVNEHLKLKIRILQNAPRDQVGRTFESKRKGSGEGQTCTRHRKIGNRDWNIESRTVFGEQK
jgi:hypothetical protein